MLGAYGCGGTFFKAAYGANGVYYRVVPRAMTCTGSMAPVFAFSATHRRRHRKRANDPEQLPVASAT